APKPALLRRIVAQVCCVAANLSCRRQFDPQLYPRTVRIQTPRPIRGKLGFFAIVVSGFDLAIDCSRERQKEILAVVESAGVCVVEAWRRIPRTDDADDPVVPLAQVDRAT